MRYALAAGLILFAACAHRLEPPITSGELASHPGTSALVAYLAQPDADPRACGGAPVGGAGDLAQGLVAALGDGTVPPQTWAMCIALLFPRLRAGQAADLVDEDVRAAAALVSDPRVERDAAVRERLDALVGVYVERGPGPAASDDAAQALDGARRSAGPDAQRAAESLRVALDLERGRWRGRPVDLGVLDLMAADVGVGLLLRASRRLPDPALRAEAERLLVRQRIAASPFPEVRAAPAAVEATVLAEGSNPVSIAEHRPVRAMMAPTAAPVRTVVVRQRPMEGRATLLGRAPDRPQLSVFPAVPLRGALTVELASIARPLTLCSPGRLLDPTPCLPTAAVATSSPLARVRDAGDLRLEEAVSEAVAVQLARQAASITVPLAVGGTSAGVFTWPVAFERPPDVVLSGGSAGAAGPDLAVNLERLEGGRLIYRVEGGGRALDAVVEATDAPSFRVVSRGAAGAHGVDGMDGSDGLSGFDGSSATCPSFGGQNGSPGGDGGRGDDGGDGGPGGRGGEVRVTVHAPEQYRQATLEVARSGVASEGGPGGRGGSGGRGGHGGRGGQGGSGATCTDDQGHAYSLGSGFSGSDGLSGSSGSDGHPGPQGPPGTVRIELAAP